MHWLLVTLSAFANLAAPGAVSLASPHCHVRAMDRRVADALADGLRRSPTFASLFAAINRSDVMVYIESMHGMPEAI